MPLLASSHSINFEDQYNTKPDETPSKEFGSYLANTSCLGCHGPTFSGGPIPGAPPEWPPAASLRLAQNSNWTEESFVKAMKEGVSPISGSQIRPPMPIALTKQMSETELKALWLYLSTLN